MQIVNANEMYGPILPISFLKNKGLSLGAKNVFSLLLSLAKGKNFCFPSQGYIAKELECSVSSVKNYLDELSNKEMIRIEHKNARASVYHLLIQVVEIATKKTEEDNSPKQKNNANENTSTLDKKELENYFLEVWSFYPKKINQSYAKRRFMELAHKGDLPEKKVLLKSIKHFMDTDFSWQKSEGRYIPQLSSFLEDKRWLSQKAENVVTPTQPVYRTSPQQLEQEEHERKKQQESYAKAKPLYEKIIAMFPSASTIERVLANGLITSAYHAGKIDDTITQNPVGNFTNVVDWVKAFSKNAKLKCAA